MKKPILKLFFLCIILSLVPLFWLKDVNLDIATFTAEYYKFIFNTFIVSMIAIYIKVQINEINKTIDRKKLHDESYVYFNNINESIQNKDYSYLKYNLLLISNNSFLFNRNISQEKIIQLAKKLNENNFDSIINSKDFKEFQNILSKHFLT